MPAALGCGRHPGCPCHPAGWGDASVGRTSIASGALGCRRGPEGPERGLRRWHGLPAAILPEPLQEEGLVSRAWPWAGWGDMCQPRGWGGQASARSLQRQPPAQPCPAALHGPGWCWHGGGVHHPPPRWRDEWVPHVPTQGAHSLRCSGHRGPHPALGGRGVICWGTSWQGLALGSSHAAPCLSFPF